MIEIAVSWDVLLHEPSCYTEVWLWLKEKDLPYDPWRIGMGKRLSVLLPDEETAIMFKLTFANILKC